MAIILTKNPLSSRQFTENSNYTNPISGSIGLMGHKFTYLTSVILQQGAKITRPIKPGFQDQCSTYFKEICARVLRIILCVALSWALLLGLIGGCLRLTASLSKRDFTLIRPKELCLSDEKIEQITIRTFNVAMMPECVCVLNEMREAHERIKEVAQELLRKDDDVICLQELFQTEAADYLAHQLQAKLPYIVYNVAPRSFGINSGLMIASKYPITYVDYWEHIHNDGVEKLSNKGTLEVTIKPSNEQDETSQKYIGGKPAPEWALIKNLMDPLISDEDESATSFDLQQTPKTGWDQSQLKEWRTTPECLDHIGIPKTAKPIQPVELLVRTIDHM